MNKIHLIVILALLSMPLQAAESLRYQVKSLQQEKKNVDHTQMKPWIKKHKPALYDSFYKDQDTDKKKRYNSEQELAFVEFYLNHQASKGWRVVSINSMGIVVFEVGEIKDKK